MACDASTQVVQLHLKKGAHLPMPSHFHHTQALSGFSSVQ
jgi:hypothetical protein